MGYSSIYFAEHRDAATFDDEAEYIEHNFPISRQARKEVERRVERSMAQAAIDRADDVAFEAECEARQREIRLILSPPNRTRFNEAAENAAVQRAKRA